VKRKSVRFTSSIEIKFNRDYILTVALVHRLTLQTNTYLLIRLIVAILVQRLLILNEENLLVKISLVERGIVYIVIRSGQDLNIGRT
jgi:hypothetical protein